MILSLINKYEKNRKKPLYTQGSFFSPSFLPFLSPSFLYFFPLKVKVRNHLYFSIKKVS